MVETKPLNKTQFLQAVADEAGIAKKDATEFWEALNNVIRKNLGHNSPGQVTLPGLLKIVKVTKPAQPAKKGVPNPFKPGELMDGAAKPAKNLVKVRPLKALKDMTI